MDSNFGLKGDEYMMKGDKILKGTKYIVERSLGSTLGNMFGNKTDRAENAMNIYKQAAT